MSDRTIALIPDSQYPGTWRIKTPDGVLSVRLNSSRAVNLAHALRNQPRARREAREKANPRAGYRGRAELRNSAATDATALQTPPVRRGVPR
jgi:hypothetical protein